MPASLKDSRLTVRLLISKGKKVPTAHTKNISFYGSFTYPIPLALNQAPGEYRVKVTEVISGYTQEVIFQVTPHERDAIAQAKK